VALLIVFGAGDWVDGYLARRLGQTSRTGAVIDPIADRLGVAVIVLALVIGGFLSLWVVLTIVAVDVALALTYLIMRPSRAPGVSWIGKLRTAVLMTGIVMVGLGVVPELDPLVVAGHVLCGIGTVLHLVAGAGYIASITRDVRGA
jgi:cardiolipin synthase